MRTVLRRCFEECVLEGSVAAERPRGDACSRASGAVVDVLGATICVIRGERLVRVEVGVRAVGRDAIELGSERPSAPDWAGRDEGRGTARAHVYVPVAGVSVVAGELLIGLEEDLAPVRGVVGEERVL